MICGRSVSGSSFLFALAFCFPFCPVRSAEPEAKPPRYTVYQVDYGDLGGEYRVVEDKETAAFKKEVQRHYAETANAYSQRELQWRQTHKGQAYTEKPPTAPRISKGMKETFDTPEAAQGALDQLIAEREQTLVEPEYARTLYLCMHWYAPWFDVAKGLSEWLQVKERLGGGSERVRVGFTGGCNYMEVFKPGSDFVFDESSMDSSMKIAVQTNTPVYFIMTGHRWGLMGSLERGEPLPKHFLEDDWNCVFYNNGLRFDRLDKKQAGNAPNFAMFSYSKYATEFRRIKLRNFRIAASKIAEFWKAHPTLVAAVSTDVEEAMDRGEFFGDYGLAALKEFREEMAAKFKTIDAFSKRCQVSFASFEAIDPPRTVPEDLYQWDEAHLRDAISDKYPFWQEWQWFREGMLDRDIEELHTILRSYGLPKAKIYTHQGPLVRGALAWPSACTVDTLMTKDGSIGFTIYGDHTLKEEVYLQAKARSPNWSIGQFNPNSKDPVVLRQALDLLLKYDCRAVCPFLWGGNSAQDAAGSSPYIIKDSIFEKVIHDFVTEQKAKEDGAKKTAVVPVVR